MNPHRIDSCKILIGTFVINFLIAGAMRLQPLIYVESLTYYQSDRKLASLPFVICFLLRNISGPIAGYLTQVLGIKFIIVAGCLMSVVSTGACYFADDIIDIIILWGIVFGLGYGFAQQLMSPFLNQHFPNHKNKANGVVFSGSSLGGVFIPPLIHILIKSYGLSDSFLLLSAIVAHTIPACLLLKNPDKKLKQTDNLNSSQRSIRDEEEKEVISESNLLSIEDKGDEIPNSLKSSSCLMQSNDEELGISKSFKSSLYSFQDKEITSKSLISNLCTIQKKDDPIPQFLIQGKENVVCEDVLYIYKEQNNEDIVYVEENKNDLKCSTENDTKGLDYGSRERNEDLNSTAETNTKDSQGREEQNKESILISQAIAPNLNNSKNNLNKDTVFPTKNTMCQNDDFENHKKLVKSKSFLNSKNLSLKSFSIFIDPAYLVILIICSNSIFVYLAYYTILVDCIRDKSVDESYEIYFVTLFSISDFVGRFGSGFIIDMKFLTTEIMLIITLLTMGASLSAFAIFNDPILLSFFNIILSMIFAFNIFLNIALIVEIVEEEKQVLAQSSKFLLTIFFNPLLPYMISHFRMTHGSYDGFLYVLSLQCCISACLAYTIPHLVKRRVNSN
ncbi:uncharacterized protein [Parasteatoda tepidariorum]|uniref:uncharacterized protein n=1 Tax=Parasteatoda tepidariorum TaxID=114398 RepID=UPI0039BD6B22